MNPHPIDPSIGPFSDPSIPPPTQRVRPPVARRLRLIASTEAEAAAPPRLRVAFASSDRVWVDQHFGTAVGFVIHEVTAERATLAGLGEFPPAAMDGREDKLAPRLEFLAGCAAVHVAAIGASAVHALMKRGIQPIRVTDEDRIETLLNGIARGLREGGVPWIERALAGLALDRSPDRFDRMADAGWSG